MQGLAFCRPCPASQADALSAERRVNAHLIVFLRWVLPLNYSLLCLIARIGQRDGKSCG